MRVLLTGGTGFVGRALSEALAAAGHTTMIMTRDPARARGPAVGWNALGSAVAEADAIVNLAGEPIAARRWVAAQRDRIRSSRIDSTRRIVEAVAAASARPSVLVSASAVGYYGPHGDEALDEMSPPGPGFLADVCRAWEAEAVAAEALGLRVVRLRIGIVLARDGGALARMLPPFRAFVGGKLGSGKQWMSWIHRDDLIGLVVDALKKDAYRGAVNAAAPNPVTNAEFTHVLGRLLARPTMFRVPALGLHLALGEMADMLLTGQRVVPAAADRIGYRWRYAELTPALRASVVH